MAGVLLITAVPVTLAVSASATPYTVIVRGLNNPRQLAWAADGGTLLVAEAGRGGAIDCGPVVGPFFPACLGASGSVTAIRNPDGAATRTRIATGFASQAEQDTGLDALGPVGVAVLGDRVLVSVGRLWSDTMFGRGKGRTVYEAGMGSPARVLATFAPSRDPGQLAVAAGRLFLADAGSATLWLLGNRTARVLTQFDAARGSLDALASGPDGRLYAAMSTGASTSGGGYELRWQIWGVHPVTGRRTLYREGPGALTGLAFGPDRSLWVAGRAAGTAAGFVTRYRPDGRVSSIAVPDPGGITVSRSGRVYVVAHSYHDWDGAGPTSNSGRVLRLRATSAASR